MAKDLEETEDESKILRLNSASILEEVPRFDGFCVVDFGGSAVDKLETIIECLEQTRRTCRYFVADTDCLAIQRTVRAINKKCEFVQASGLLGSAGAVLRFARKKLDGPMLFISLGSSLTNNDPATVRRYLAGWGNITCAMIIGHDTPSRGEEAAEKYHHTERFTKFINYGLDRSKRLLSSRIYRDKRWEYKCELKKEPWRHCLFLKAKEDINDHHGYSIPEGHRIDVYTTWKYTHQDMHRMILDADADLTLDRTYDLPGRSSKVYIIMCPRTWDFWRQPGSEEERAIRVRAAERMRERAARERAEEERASQEFLSQERAWRERLRLGRAPDEEVPRERALQERILNEGVSRSGISQGGTSRTRASRDPHIPMLLNPSDDSSESASSHRSSLGSSPFMSHSTVRRTS